MSYDFYVYLAFVPNTSEASVENLFSLLKEYYQKSNPAAQVILEDQTIYVRFKNYEFKIDLNEEEYVKEEAEELSTIRHEDYQQRDLNKELLRTYTRRFELGAPVDPNMDYFNDSLYIVETIEKIEGAIIFSF